MSSVSQNFMKLFRGSSGAETIPAQGAEKLTRRSSGLGELSRTWKTAEGLCVLDLGSTSATNIRHFTEHGHRIYSEDLLTASTDPELLITDEKGVAALDSRKFLADNLVYPAAHCNDYTQGTQAPASSTNGARSPIVTLGVCRIERDRQS